MGQIGSARRRRYPNARSGDASGVDHHHDPAHRLLREQDPLVRLKLKKLPQPLRTVERTTRALAIGTQSIATPMNRTVVDAISNTLVLQTMAG
jgi:hypothetical protein